MLVVVLVTVVATPFTYLWRERHKAVVKNEAFEAEQRRREQAEDEAAHRPLSEDEREQLRRLVAPQRHDERDA